MRVSVVRPKVPRLGVGLAAAFDWADEDLAKRQCSVVIVLGAHVLGQLAGALKMAFALLAGELPNGELSAGTSRRGRLCVLLRLMREQLDLRGEHGEAVEPSTYVDGWPRAWCQNLVYVAFVPRKLRGKVERRLAALLGTGVGLRAQVQCLMLLEGAALGETRNAAWLHRTSVRVRLCAVLCAVALQMVPGPEGCAAAWLHARVRPLASVFRLVQLQLVLPSVCLRAPRLLAHVRLLASVDSLMPLQTVQPTEHLPAARMEARETCQ